MEYSKVLEDAIMRPRHKFIYGSLEERGLYLRKLADIYHFNSSEKTPVGIYISEPGLETCENKNCDEDKIKFFNSRYFEINIMYHILNKLINELSEEIKRKYAQDILKPFNYANNHPFYSLEELRDELLKARGIYLKEYKYYKETGNLNDFRKELRIHMVLIDLVLSNLKRITPNLDYISLFINKESDYSIIYMQIINFYINARSNGILNINVGCNNLSEWKTLIDLNGNCIQSIHDFDQVNMEDYILKRKK